METTSRPVPIVLRADAISALPERTLGSIPGVTHRVVWSTTASMAGVMTVAAGHHLGRHAHHANHHHIWVVSGRATILDLPVDAGTYVHVPSGVEHDIDATETDGCTVFYLYIRHPD